MVSTLEDRIERKCLFINISVSVSQKKSFMFQGAKRKTCVGDPKILSAQAVSIKKASVIFYFNPFKKLF
jgi:hypothetical protein